MFVATAVVRRQWQPLYSGNSNSAVVIILFVLLHHHDLRRHGVVIFGGIGMGQRTARAVGGASDQAL